MLRSLLPLYRAITTVNLVDGESTSFWHDVWDGDDCTRKGITVRQVYDDNLVVRRSAAAYAQVQQVTEVMGRHTLSPGKDQRKSVLLKSNGDLDTSLIYRALKTANSNPDAWAKFVWNNKAPPRVKFFTWLLSQGRIQCKSNLQRKGIVENSACDVCNAADETSAHILFGCPHAVQFWNALHIPTDQQWPVQTLKEIQSPDHIPQKHFCTFLLLCSWHIWKRRNNVVFRNERTTLTAVITACKSEAVLWSARLPQEDAAIGS
jgi:hypothetical protein